MDLRFCDAFAIKLLILLRVVSNKCISIGNKWPKAHEREREGEKKNINYGTRVTSWAPKKEKREKGNHRGIPLPCAYRRPPPAPALSKTNAQTNANGMPGNPSRSLRGLDRSTHSRNCNLKAQQKKTTDAVELQFKRWPCPPDFKR